MSVANPQPVIVDATKQRQQQSDTCNTRRPPFQLKKKERETKHGSTHSPTHLRGSFLSSLFPVAIHLARIVPFAQRLAVFSPSLHPTPPRPSANATTPATTRFCFHFNAFIDYYPSESRSSISPSVNAFVFTSNTLRGASTAMRTGKRTPIELPFTHLRVTHNTKQHTETNNKKRHI